MRSIHRAEAGKPGRAAALLRILTPDLEIPRHPRRAKKSAGDALEMRGGIGYIEEFATRATIARRPHLGSIWEGTGNIVAIDALKARGWTPRRPIAAPPPPIWHAPSRRQRQCAGRPWRSPFAGIDRPRHRLLRREVASRTDNEGRRAARPPVLL